MKGIVNAVNLKKGFVAIETKGGEYSILELLGGYGVEVGDVIVSYNFV